MAEGDAARRDAAVHQRASRRHEPRRAATDPPRVLRGARARAACVLAALDRAAGPDRARAGAARLRDVDGREARARSRMDRRPLGAPLPPHRRRDRVARAPAVSCEGSYQAAADRRSTAARRCGGSGVARAAAVDAGEAARGRRRRHAQVDGRSARSRSLAAVTRCASRARLGAVERRSEAVGPSLDGARTKRGCSGTDAGRARNLRLRP